MDAMLLEFDFLDDLRFQYSAFSKEYKRIGEEKIDEEDEVTGNGKSDEKPSTAPE